MSAPKIMHRYYLKLQHQFKENYNKHFVSDIESRGAQEHAGEVLTTMLCASGTWTTDRETSCPPPDGEVGYLGQNTDACQGDSGGN